MAREEFLWTERYRPRSIDDCILPSAMKKTFKAFVEAGEVPNLLLSGGSGVGKTTVAKAMLNELGHDCIVINGSLNGNIDTLRNEIQNFASSISFTGGRKYVILDEADHLNPQSTQPALRNFMEEFSKNCGFGFTCNMPKRIIEPLHSRTATVNFKITKADKASVAMQIMKRVCFILDSEGVPYDKAAVAGLIKKFFPDWRRVINELQNYAATGRIDSGILVNTAEENLKELMGFLKDRKWDEARKWCGENNDLESTDVMRQIYDQMRDYVKPSSMPGLVVALAKYQYQAAFVADHEINLVACLTEFMVEAEWK